MRKQPKPKPTPAAAASPQSGGPQTLLMAGIAIVLLALGVVIWLIASGRGNAPASPANNSAEAVPVEALQPGPAPAATPPPAPAGTPPTPGGGQLLPSGLRLETVREGRGPLVTPADTVHFRYELRTYGGRVLESNLNAPRAAVMPVAGLVPGFAEGLTHMRAGGEARFWVPPHLGYGSSPPGGGIGPNDTLEFRVRLERIVPAGASSSNPANAATEAPAPAPGQ